MWNKLGLYFHTLRYLKFTQWQYRIWYGLRNRLIKPTPKQPGVKKKRALPENFPLMQRSIPQPVCYQASLERHQFEFLNLRRSYANTIDWNDATHGKLWTYNLNYFEYLQQAQLSKEAGLFLLQDFLKQYATLKDAHEPFPTSLRIVNWVKFLSRQQVNDAVILRALDEQISHLEKNLEYHLLGNHLLENAFALLIGGLYLQRAQTVKTAERLLRQELAEQILADGAHFELSPMYHQLMLYRLLDCINILQSSGKDHPDLLGLLTKKAKRMLAWLQAITFENGQIPRVNDTAPGIAPSTKELLDYADRLGIKNVAPGNLGASGYRKLKNARMEVLVDIGKIGPDYIPGHAHSDSLSFAADINKEPFILDLGISTYEKNARRQWERSTAAHNTVQIDELEQSEVWGGFRVARRAKTTILKDEKNEVSSSHDGYRRYGITHRRSWTLEEAGLKITDELEGQGRRKATARFYFHPERQVNIKAKEVHTDLGVLAFSGAASLLSKKFNYPQGYNTYETANCVEVTFENQLVTWIKI